VGAGQNDRFVDDYRFLVRDARLIVDPDWDAGARKHRDAAVATARRGPVRDEPDIDTASLCASQRSTMPEPVVKP